MFTYRFSSISVSIGLANFSQQQQNVRLYTHYLVFEMATEEAEQCLKERFLRVLIGLFDDLGGATAVSAW